MRITPAGLRLVDTVPVGMEPVAVAVRNSGEVWVVNHLSDSVSIVDTSTIPARVVRTLDVGDEPRDIVFAGPNRDHAYIAAANRDQPRAADSTDGNADIWVFDATNPVAPLTIINLFGDVPRPLAVSPDGNKFYAGVFFSGNQTLTLDENKVNGVLGLGLPDPLDNVDGDLAPEHGLILKWNGTDWVDGAGRVWPSGLVQKSLPDYDVFVIDAAAAVPVEIDRISTVGTTLFNMAVNPQTGKLYVSNTDAQNHVRFTGEEIHSASTTIRGHLAESRISVIDGTTVTPIHLNKHIDFNVFPGTQDENDRSLAFPLDMAVSSDGATLYVAALGSSKVGIFDTTQLENDTFVPDTANHIELTGGGPTGIVLDEASNRLYVLTRFNNSVSVVDLATKTELSQLALHNPEPQATIDGRRFLYDARFSSSRGNEACASCHIFGDLDHLAWDMGDPDNSVVSNPNPIKANLAGLSTDFHPIKGPMTTQTMRGLLGHGPMHWRGDQTGGNDPGGDPLDENAAFKKFVGAFEGVMGRTEPATDEEMQAYADFALPIMLPPNPIRSIDNQLTDSQQRGRALYLTQPMVPGAVAGQLVECNHCHVLDPAADFFGTDGETTRIPNQAQVMKVPHLRNLYTKLGLAEDVGPITGPVIRGFDPGHDGRGERLIDFLNTATFRFDLLPDPDQSRMDVANFLVAYDSNLAPVTGRQVTMRADNVAEARASVDIYVASAMARQCDVVVKGVWQGQQRGWMQVNGNGLFRSDRAGEALFNRTHLESIAQQSGQQLTYTAVPRGSGRRMAIDRDEDGAFDRDEIDAGSDPMDPASTPADP